MESIAQSIRILLVEDVESDARLSLLQLKHAGLHCVSQRVESESDFRRALGEFAPDIILSDFSLPQFDGLSALEVAREVTPDTPFIFVSGTMGEERAVTALRRGAVDYLLKGNLTRLPSAISRALEDARARRERKVEQARIARLDRVLRMLSGINALMVRARDRTELLNETCRLAVVGGGYATAQVYLESPGVAGLQALAGAGTDNVLTDTLRDAILLESEAGRTLLDRVARGGREFVCNNTSTLQSLAGLRTVLQEGGLLSLVALPLILDNTPMGALVLTGHGADTVSTEELQMLREVSGNLSFALQYLAKDTTVQFLSHFDPLTGLAKRSLFCERLTTLIPNLDVRRSRFTVAIIDIVQLSVINDSFSRRIGDLLLQQVAGRLKQRYAQSDHIAHFGGGTFAILRDIGDLTVEATAAAAREHGDALFATPFVIEDREISLTTRSGLAVYPEHGTDADSLVQKAEAALREARTSGERETHYSEHHQTLLVTRHALEHKLRLALEREQFELHYQPKVNVISRRIEGVEALIRWRDPQAGVIAPADFLPALESSGLILEVGNWVIRRAALDCQQWLRSGIAPVRIAVNISPAQLHRPDFVETFLGALSGWATPFAGLDIEITEGTLHEELAAEVTKLERLRQAGVRIAIDDFGTGYSSLSRLAKLPIDTLKIDRSFISEMLNNGAGKVLVRTIINLARAFRLTTVAEGVETQGQLEFLRRAHCDQSQGYLHSRPVPGPELMKLLEHGRGHLVLPPEVGPVPAAGDYA
jgi:diguanylate cyclase (GGDEF)-like protein